MMSRVFAASRFGEPPFCGKCARAADRRAGILPAQVWRSKCSAWAYRIENGPGEMGTTTRSQLNRAMRKLERECER